MKGGGDSGSSGCLCFELHYYYVPSINFNYLGYGEILTLLL